MSSLYKVTEIGGKGLGCVANSDIKKGSLILMEKPQLSFENEERIVSSMPTVKSLLKSFFEMSKADQLEYMTLHNKYNNIQNFQNSVDIPNCKEILDRNNEEIEDLKFEIGKIEKDPEKAKEILKILGIYFTNCFEHSVYLSWARFNHSCQPNATFFVMNGQLQVRAIGNIKAGKEINFTYLGNFSGFRNQNIVCKIFLKEGGLFALVTYVKMMLMLKLLRRLKRLKSSPLRDNQPSKLELYLKLLNTIL